MKKIKAHGKKYKTKLTYWWDYIYKIWNKKHLADNLTRTNKIKNCWMKKLNKKESRDLESKI